MNQPNSELPPKDPFEKEWKKVEDFVKKGRPESALKIVEEIQEKAKSRLLKAQIIKSVIYKARFIQEIEDEGEIKSIAYFESEYEQAPQPIKSILASQLAQVYRSYLDERAWQINQRTDLESGKETEDIREWTINQFTDRIVKLHLAAIADKRLQKNNLEEFAAIIENAEETELRPSLYDLLVHRAIDYFSDTKAFLTEPINAFQIDKAEYWEDAKKFSKLKISANNSESHKYLALRLFQNTTKYLLKSKHHRALADLEVKRYRFLNQHSIGTDKEKKYITALENLADDLKRKGGSEIALLALAQHHLNLQDYRKAFDIAQNIKQSYKDSHQAKGAQAILDQVMQKSLSGSSEAVYVPKKPILVKVDYRNIDKVYYRVIRISPKQFEELQGQNPEQKTAFVNKLEPVLTGDFNLPDFGDYKSHSAEYALDGLTRGRYLLTISNSQELKAESNVGAGFVDFQVTNLGMWNRNTIEGKTSIVCVHRTTGEPLEGVEGIFRAWDNRKKKLTDEVMAISDEDGFILPELQERTAYQVELKYDGDYYLSDQNVREYRIQEEPQERNQVTFFTDRRLYRPGQTIYYKGLAVQRDKHNIPSILVGRSVNVSFRDANYQEIEKVTLTTNEFGTFSGAFTAPEGGRNGRMSIQADLGGNAWVQVEEYKRPTFEVLIDTIKTAYEPGDELAISGIAKAYAGFGIDGATVKIRVTKEQRFWCYPWWRRGWFPPNQGTKEVFQTTLETDDEGRFDFSFESDMEENQDRFSYAYYVIYADVTNQAGETRSGNSTFSLSRTPFSLSTNLEEKNNLNDLKKLEITAKNFANQLIEASGSVKVLALISPENTFINRYWGKADTTLLSKEDFVEKFPHLAFEDEDLLTSWQVQSIVLDTSFSSGQSLSIDPTSWGPGYYKIQIEGKDERGRAQQLESYFELYDPEDNLVPYNATLWSHFEDKMYEPGDKVDYLLGTAEEAVKVLFEVSKWGELVVSKWINISELDKVQVEVGEEDRGNLIATIQYALHNRSHQETNIIKVPWTNKKLDIQLSTFRDKTKPGAKEDWTLKVNYPGDEMILTELTAAMYDASLDAIMGHNWAFYGYPSENYLRRPFAFNGWSTSRYWGLYDQWVYGQGIPASIYPSLKWFGWYIGFDFPVLYDAVSSEGVRMKRSMPAPMTNEAEVMSDAGLEEVVVEGSIEPESTSFAGDIRENLDELVFFYPDLKSDEQGSVELSFTMNEALTRWKFMVFGHTKDLQYGQAETLITTQKELMVIPHIPRFMRQGDEIQITSTVKNLSNADLKGNVELKLFDAITNASLDEAFHNHQSAATFDLGQGLSYAAKWTLHVPDDFTSVVRTEIVATGGEFSDGQADEIPVVTNRTLVTESLPLWVNGNEKREFTFKSFLDHSASKVNQNYTVEFTSNPVWYAVQALPYMMEFPYECTEQVWNRYYAHALGVDIINQFPAIKSVMSKWKDTDALLSNLQKNQELKSALLKETPWVLDALSEEEQKKNVALLFDMVKMEAALKQDLRTILDRQNGDGGFSWFSGGRSNVYISQYILEGIGRLNQLDVINSALEKDINQMVANIIDFVDAKIAERYQRLLKLNKENDLKLYENQLSSIDIHYLYARSFFPGRKWSAEAGKAFFYFKDQARKFWVDRSIHEQAMLGIALYQFGEEKHVNDLMISLKERSLTSEELGVYWKYNRGYHWSQAPIETQAKLITLYELMEEDVKTIDGLKKYLLKHKQTNRWNTTKSTAAAIHALLLSGNRWIENDAPVALKIGTRNISEEIDELEAGSGYFKKVMDVDIVDASYAEVKVDNPNNQPAFGAVYYQYWEDRDKVKNFEDTPLKLTKEVFIKENTPAGPELLSINADKQLEIGDLVTIRITLEVDRIMEFVHMKDSRSSGLEPENVISQYKWQDGLGYFESTKDLSTDFFFDYLPKGKYVFEYPLRVSHSGRFSNGITTIQCMYAPEFTSHSEGVRLNVK